MKKRNYKTDDNLVRLHPKDGGVEIKYGNQKFSGVSSDVFVGLDKFDMSKPYLITRKFNISIAVNPTKWPAKDFFKTFMVGGPKRGCPFDTNALAKTKKSNIHGDDKTGLLASKELLGILNQKGLIKPSGKQNGFMVGHEIYVYDSIGVAANNDYNKITTRTENNSSHFEIKFRKLSNGIPKEELRLNIHLSATAKSYGKEAVCERLKAAVLLFYAELGALNDPYKQYKTSTDIRSFLSVNLEDYDFNGLSCRHAKSKEVLEEYTVAKKYAPP